MSEERKKLKVLLLQARNDQVTLIEEQSEFIRFGKLESGQLDSINMTQTPDFEPSVADDYDAVFVGGSSDADVFDMEKFPFIENAQRLLVHCVETNKPVLASCYGFQLVVQALGGKVERHEEYSEMEGSAKIKLTDNGIKDDLFGELDDVFRAVSIHKDSATKLPENVIILARTEKCPYHAIKVVDKPFYATQFHAEIDKPDLIARIQRYQDRYLDSSDMLNKLIENTVDMDQVNSIVLRFIDKIVIKNK